MNGTPRAVNRVVLAIAGLVLLALGAALAALAVVPAAGRLWQDWAGPQMGRLSGLAARTRLAPGGGSWIWLVVAACLLVLVIFMVSWVANQGKGRTNVLFQRQGTAADDGAAGKVVLSTAVAEQSLKAALLERGDLLGVSVTSYAFRGQPAVRVRVLPRQGVAPHEVAADIASLVDALDALLGVQVPVLVSLGSGTRARFTKAERVR
ncbi:MULTISPECIES: hypothetical protein [unclassified Arthrobacter]|uniref:hypothetical protein n=1 Tax=unclassified Arthrobacter TaxID=235627 RepID=UPI00159D3582|nr:MULTISPECIES: hypothetical protein [unclassified Arthrobacter]MCQ9162644.1 hypothetical protein [Arthrobacter sp. STN4]NVM97373.1 hypothetical protein [Arthrobacter sp. SDTb3-6]